MDYSIFPCGARLRLWLVSVAAVEVEGEEASTRSAARFVVLATVVNGAEIILSCASSEVGSSSSAYHDASMGVSAAAELIYRPGRRQDWTTYSLSHISFHLAFLEGTVSGESDAKFSCSASNY